MHWGVAWARATLALIVAGAVGLALVSGGSVADPRTPAALPGLPPPFLGTAVAGSGGLTAAIDAYGDVVDLRTPGLAGRALIDNPSARQAAGSVPADTGIVPRVVWENSKDFAAYSEPNPSSSPGEPLWRADSVAQHFLSGTNVVRTVARFGPVRVVVVYAAGEGRLACLTIVRAPRGESARISIAVAEPQAADRLHCDDRTARGIVHRAARADRRWLARARPLGAGAPAWAERMYRRSLLTLRALTNARTGAVAAGARDGWAYVWPRDAGTAALAYAAAGYRREARRVARFLLGLDLRAAARFQGDGTPVPGRAAQGDAFGWATVAARAGGILPPGESPSWRNRADYQEGEPGDYLANAIAAAGSMLRTEVEDRKAFATRRGLVRRAGDPASGLDSAAAWAVRPFPDPTLFPAVRRTLLRLASKQTRFGITPGEAWPGADPWTAPTAWTAWSLAALGNRRAALGLLTDLRRATTPAGSLPERVDAHTGIPTSTTPLTWSAAFTILTLHQLWPSCAPSPASNPSAPAPPPCAAVR